MSGMLCVFAICLAGFDEILTLQWGASRTGRPFHLGDLSTPVEERSQIDFLEGFLGLGRTTAFAFLPSSLQLPEVLRPALGDLLPPFRPSLTAAGSFFFGKIQRV